MFKFFDPFESSKVIQTIAEDRLFYFFFAYLMKASNDTIISE
jgi:hypothetical protein